MKKFILVACAIILAAFAFYYVYYQLGIYDD